MANSPHLASGWRSDIIGGLTTFLTVAYIVVVNPAILSTEGTGIPFSGALTATVFICFTMTLFMGLYAKLPFAIAPGMGINAFFTYTLILGEQIPWQTALGMVFWSGVIFLLISITPVRVAMVRAIPQNLRIAAAAGIGLFLSFIGLKNCGMIKAHPATLVAFGGVTEEVLIMIAGLVVIVGLFLQKRPYAMLGGITVATVLAIVSGKSQPPAELFQMPDFGSVFFQLDIWGALKWSLLPAIITLMCTDLFDSISTFIGVAHATGLVDENGEPKNLYRGLIVDSVATLSAGLVGTSAGTAYIESAAGIEAGGRSGRAAVVTALAFLPCFFLAGIAQAVPIYATAPVLLVVGFLMFRSATAIAWQRFEEALPAFLTIALIPLTFSITQGILWGFVSHIVCFVLADRRQDISIAMWGLGLAAALLLYLGH
jgi:AGZA family xanthine/uracil permease-like MFS transporter